MSGNEGSDSLFLYLSLVAVALMLLFAGAVSALGSQSPGAGSLEIGDGNSSDGGINDGMGRVGEMAGERRSDMEGKTEGGGAFGQKELTKAIVEGEIDPEKLERSIDQQEGEVNSTQAQEAVNEGGSTDPEGLKQAIDQGDVSPEELQAALTAAGNTQGGGSQVTDGKQGGETGSGGGDGRSDPGEQTGGEWEGTESGGQESEGEKVSGSQQTQDGTEATQDGGGQETDGTQDSTEATQDGGTQDGGQETDGTQDSTDSAEGNTEAGRTETGEAGEASTEGTGQQGEGTVESDSAESSGEGGDGVSSLLGDVPRSYLLGAVGLGVVFLAGYLYAKGYRLPEALTSPRRFVAALTRASFGIARKVESAVRRVLDTDSYSELISEAYSSLLAFFSSAKGSGSESSPRRDSPEKPSKVGARTEETSSREFIFEAWSVVLEASPYSSHETKTPGQVSRGAVRNGMPQDPVGDITEAFREVEYGGKNPDERVKEVEKALSELGQGSGTPTEGSDSGVPAGD